MDEARRRRPDCRSTITWSLPRATKGANATGQMHNTTTRIHHMIEQDLPANQSPDSGSRPLISGSFRGIEVPVDGNRRVRWRGAANAMPLDCLSTLLNTRGVCSCRRIDRSPPSRPTAGSRVNGNGLEGRSACLGGRNRSRETQRLTAIPTDRMMPPLDASSKIDCGNQLPASDVRERERGDFGPRRRIRHKSGARLHLAGEGRHV